MKNPYITLNQALVDLKKGGMIILQDSEDRGKTGAILFLASKADQEKIEFITNKARGLLCVALSPQKAETLGFSGICSIDDGQLGTPFVQPGETGTAREVSLTDLLAGVKLSEDSKSKVADLYKRGIIFPLTGHPDGLSARQGHAEGALELARLAGEEEAVPLCVILDKNGNAARGQEPAGFALEHKIGLLTMNALIEKKIEPNTEKTVLPTPYGVFSLYTFVDGVHEPTVALVAGDLSSLPKPLVRIHSECLTGDIFGSHRCDCGEQKEEALRRIGKEGGMFIYLRQEGRGIGLVEKMKAYNLQDQGLDTVEANLALGHKEDHRDYSHAIEVLRFFELKSLRLLTNNPEKIKPLQEAGINVERESIEIPAGEHNKQYLAVKKEKMNHILKLKH